MSDWKERLEAVATLANRPRPMDGELYCGNRTCKNKKLNRTDLTCWVCGGTQFIPASEEMLASNRFTFVTPPRREEPKAEKPKPQMPAIDAYIQYLYGAQWPTLPLNISAPQPVTVPATPQPQLRTRNPNCLFGLEDCVCAQETLLARVKCGYRALVGR